MNTKELKQALIDRGCTIEPSNMKGQYKVTSSNGLFYQTVRFTNAKGCTPEQICVLDYDFENNPKWLPKSLDGFIKYLEG